MKIELNWIEIEIESKLKKRAWQKLQIQNWNLFQGENTQGFKEMTSSDTKGRWWEGRYNHTEAYIIFQRLDHVNKDNLLPMAVNRGTRNQDFKLRRRYSRTDIRKHTFTNRTVEVWNSLPGEVKNASSLNIFKNRIDSLPQLIERFYEYDE